MTARVETSPFPPLESVKVADVMHRGVVTCPLETPLRTVARMMATHKVHYIRIRWQFSLTAGDSVQTKGFFQVEQAPEPATVALMGLGLAALVVARRRA